MLANSKTVPKDTVFYRAQVASGEQTILIDPGIQDSIYAPAGVDRMVPKPEYSANGRISPKGMAVLYLASNVRTAVAESRPSLGEDVTVAEFRTVQDIRIAVFDQKYQNLMRLQELSGASDDEVVINDINHAFAKFIHPTRVDTEYVPTQILTELIRTLELDGVGYNSAVSSEGFNLALFDIALATPTIGRLYSIKKIQYDFSETAEARRYPEPRTSQ